MHLKHIAEFLVVVMVGIYGNRTGDYAYYFKMKVEAVRVVLKV